MRSHLAMCIVLNAALCAASAAPVEVTEKLLTGIWECGPTAMQGPPGGPASLITVVSMTDRAPDLTFSSLTTTVILYSDRRSLTFIAADKGSWRLEGTTLLSEYKESTFVSASDPRISREAGQQVLDAELRKKSVFKSAILDIGPTALRSIPVDSAHAGAVVEATCRRTDAARPA